MKKYFVLIIASQRTGSTLFCQDLESIGMGVPREYAIGQIRSEGDFDLGKLFSRCRTETQHGEIYALKTMLNYTPKIVRSKIPDLNGLKSNRSRKEHVEIMKLFYQILAKEFDEIITFVLTRDSVLDTAISRALSQLTQIYHTNEAGSHVNYEHLATDLILDKALENMPRASRENKILHMLKADFGSKAVHIDYADLVENESTVFLRCKEYLSSFGFNIQAEGFKRDRNKKVVPKDFQMRLKEAMKREVIESWMD